MDDVIRVELKGSLSGRHLLLDPGQLTFGLLEDLQSDRAALVLDGLARCIVGGDLAQGTDRAGLRRLITGDANAVIEGVAAAFAVPKS